MTSRKEHLTYCQRCINRKFDKTKGVICGLTQEIANFEKKCPDFIEDQALKAKTSEKKKLKKEEDADGVKVIYAFLMTATLPIIFTLAWSMWDTYDNTLTYVQDIFMGAFFGLLFSSSYYRLQFFKYRFRRAIAIFGEDNTQVIGVLISAILIVLLIMIRFYGFEF